MVTKELCPLDLVIVHQSNTVHVLTVDGVESFISKFCRQHVDFKKCDCCNENVDYH
mgnify:CR=1 FL=1